MCLRWQEKTESSHDLVVSDIVFVAIDQFRFLVAADLSDYRFVLYSFSLVLLLNIQKY